VGDIAVYTSIMGGKDELLEPAVVENGVDYVCFTDDAKITSNVYDVRHIIHQTSCPNLAAKEYKFFPHRFLPHHRITVWIDGSHTPVKPIVPLAHSALHTETIALFAHPERDCLFDEAEACIAAGREDPDKLKQQVDVYKKAGMPKHHGLARGGIIFRRKVSALNKTMQLWWDHAVEYSRRDQISFPFVAWKTGLNYELLGSKIYEEHFDMKHHLWFAKGDNRRKKYKGIGRVFVFDTLRKAGKL
jgi:hypothetical protein